MLAGAFVLALLPPAALAQKRTPAAPPVVPQSGFFANVGRWLDQQAASAKTAWQGTGVEVRNFGREAGIAAKTGATPRSGGRRDDQAAQRTRRDRIRALRRRCERGAGLPAGRQRLVPLARPRAGKSLEMTAAEDCPVKVYLSGRNNGAECTSFTFVSRALCQ